MPAAPAYPVGTHSIARKPYPYPRGRVWAGPTERKTMGCLIFHAKKWDCLYKYSRDGHTIDRETNRQQKTVISLSVDYAKSERQFRVNGAAVPFPTAHQRRSLFIDFITLAHAYSVHSFQDGKNAFCQ